MYVKLHNFLKHWPFMISGDDEKNENHSCSLILGSKDTVISAEVMLTRMRWRHNYKLEILVCIWKESVVSNIAILIQHTCGQTEKNGGIFLPLTPHGSCSPSTTEFSKCLIISTLEMSKDFITKIPIPIYTHLITESFISICKNLSRHEWETLRCRFHVSPHNLLRIKSV
jgi:hypothetical protein